MKCGYCGIEIIDRTAICPFCKMALRQEQKNSTGEEQNRKGRKERTGSRKKRKTFKQEEYYVETYPEVQEQLVRKRKFLGKSLFFVILIESILVITNVFTYERIAYPWSAFVGGIFLFGILSAWNIFRFKVGHIQKIYMQMLLFFLLLFFVDIMLKSGGEILEYGLPVLVDVHLGVIVFCMLVNRKNWQNYILMQLFMVVLGGVLMILVSQRILKHSLLVSITFNTASMFFLGTIMLGGRKAWQELRRKFHV